MPGFYRAESGGLRFSLYGDYALIPYYDREGYLLTVEGRLMGEPKKEGDPKYKALVDSGLHLYVHPRFDPQEVVAFCEGAIGAMVAARYGIPVASIKGMYNYRRPPASRDGHYSTLPEFAGVDFTGRELVYIPDIDVKPKTREEALSLVPEACEWLIQRQGGRAKVVLLPEGFKDLDEWLLSVDEEKRVEKFYELLEEAVEIGEWDPKGRASQKEVRLDRSPGAYEHRGESATEDEGTEGVAPRAGGVQDDGCEYGEADEAAEDSVGEGRNQGSGASEPETDSPRGSGDKERTKPMPDENAVPDGDSRGSVRSQHFKEIQDDSSQDSGVEKGGSTTDTGEEEQLGERSSKNLPEKVGDSGKGSENEDDEGTGTQGDGEGGSEKKPAGESGQTEGTQNKGETRHDEDDVRRRSHPSMQWWYDVARRTPEEVEETRRITRLRDQVDYQRPRGESTPLHLQKWNFGEAAIAVAVTVFVAVAVCVVVYLLRAQDGLLGSTGSLLSLPPWWLEAAMYLVVGGLAAEQVAKLRYRKRYRQLVDHSRGKEN